MKPQDLREEPEQGLPEISMRRAEEKRFKTHIYISGARNRLER